MKQKLLSLAGYSAFVSLLGGVILSGVAHATAPGGQIDNVNNLDQLFCPIFTWMFWILLAVAVIMVFWAAYEYVTAGDDTEKVHRATKTITYAAVAIVVALLAVGFPYLVGSIFNFSTTNPIAC